MLDKLISELLHQLENDKIADVIFKSANILEEINNIVEAIIIKTLEQKTITCDEYKEELIKIKNKLEHFKEINSGFLELKVENYEIKTAYEIMNKNRIGEFIKAIELTIQSITIIFKFCGEDGVKEFIKMNNINLSGMLVEIGTALLERNEQL